ncbi:N-acetyltransferase [Vibrio fluvialis]|uniref:N-acetyltransferase n=1 Tax=Vibrio fluvialis TaxID=676 RepID=UPI001C9D3C7E|nr:N-acetyltransferase [Vibrio fluvialis]MBY7900100.1 N-acetyltransferase [Vibrio fluvialis]MBY7938871.1 N-acetyltransferase [Vibrio fluvialis]MBY8165765.1 N-acetyltransferase [Vibrio fluvialis]MBY8256088.1 N-acetyltransferase [Vibrio fluvialis]MBY8264287.1 N-acetyltransferase [Vibrio fluvialis]
MTEKLTGLRPFRVEDMDDLLNVWLSASIEAHDFVAASYWQSQVENMRHLYLPASEVYVYLLSGELVGFYALYENTLAAIFVSPDCQGQGIGKLLLEHAKQQRAQLSLTVYKENQASCQFYLKQGFHVVREQTDEHTGHAELVMST